MFAIMYFYNGREFNQMLLSQPISRNSIFTGEYLGIAISLSLCLILGIGVPGFIFVILNANGYAYLLTLIIIGSILTFIFTGLALAVAIRNENRIKGFSYTLFIWLLLAVIYDGLFLILLFYFKDYPLENFSIFASILNPIDLSRISLMLKLDSAALMGFTGAVFQKFFGSFNGLLISLMALLFWIAIPFLLYINKALKKDF
jgi:Cu-processing system permease protein